MRRLESRLCSCVGEMMREGKKGSRVSGLFMCHSGSACSSGNDEVWLGVNTLALVLAGCIDLAASVKRHCVTLTTLCLGHMQSCACEECSEPFELGACLTLIETPAVGAPRKSRVHRNDQDAASSNRLDQSLHSVLCFLYSIFAVVCIQ